MHPDCPRNHRSCFSERIENVAIIHVLMQLFSLQNLRLNGISGFLLTDPSKVFLNTI